MAPQLKIKSPIGNEVFKMFLGLEERDPFDFSKEGVRNAFLEQMKQHMHSSANIAMIMMTRYDVCVRLLGEEEAQRFCDMVRLATDKCTQLKAESDRTSARLADIVSASTNKIQNKIDSSTDGQADDEEEPEAEF